MHDPDRLSDKLCRKAWHLFVHVIPGCTSFLISQSAHGEIRLGDRLRTQGTSVGRLSVDMRTSAILRSLRISLKDITALRRELRKTTFVDVPDDFATWSLLQVGEARDRQENHDADNEEHYDELKMRGIIPFGRKCLQISVAVLFYSIENKSCVFFVSGVMKWFLD